jgi:RNA polymerase sigma-70 factor (ECF subfamily)
VPTPADPETPRKIQLRLPFKPRQLDEEESRALANDAGGQAWISQLWNLYQGFLLELAHYHLHDWDRAQEVVQDTWIDFLKGLHRFEGRCSAKTWLVQILKRCIKKEQKRTILRRAREALMGVAQAGSSGHDSGTMEIWRGGSNDPEQLLIAHECLEHIMRAERSLPKRQAEVWMMRDLFQWTSEEVSTTLAISPENQRILLHRARQRLKLELERDFGKAPSAESRRTHSHDLQRF